ncbi:universal stress protein [Desulfospira joergensenii]|uniref:universal stress protein n=1 Tax=Desulfospira joergensenii TaxID=53329 RepID=UPI0003B3032E|nr:universal stress protein [Desulfospira joergensenii]
MSRIKKILACVDFSEYSSMTLEYAMDFAKDTDRQIVAFHVINLRALKGVEKITNFLPSEAAEKENREKNPLEGIDSSANYLPYDASDEKYIESLREEKKAAMENLIKDLFSDEKSRIDIKIEAGKPYDAILKAIETEEADLVVMANKGRTDLSRVLFGSSAEKVFRHSPVPVLGVRDKNKFKRK